MSLRQIAAQRPVLAAVLCAGLQFLITGLIIQAGIAFAPAAAFGKVKLVAFASTVIFPLAMAQALGLWRQVGLEWRKAKPGHVFFASMLLCVLFASMGFHANDKHPFAPEVLIQFINAFGEELLFRGVIFAILLTLPRWQAIVISGVLFGAMHLMHGFMDGNWNHAMWWAAATCLSGAMFAAVRYGTGSLWLVIVLHMVLNLCKIYSNIEFAAGPNALLIAERVAYGFEIALTAYVIFMGSAREKLVQVRSASVQ